MQIRSVAPPSNAPYDQPQAQWDRAAAESGQATEPEARPSRGDILAEAAGSGLQDPAQRPPEVQAEIAELKRRDQEVRQHEGAHMSAGGAHVRGGASYSYQAGPDGKRYAVGGEVSIDTSPVANNPEATIAKMQTVRRAALAPANPSGKDLAVAARASQGEMQARMQAAAQAQATSPEEDAAEPAEGEKETQKAAPASPQDTVGSDPAATGTLLDAYA